jgi:hypothetical protein
VVNQLGFSDKLQGMKRIILIGPILFATVTLSLTTIKYDFLRGLGWHPINDPTFDWPSGLALGPYGIIMTLTFIVSGLLMSMLGLRLRADLKPGTATTIGSTLVVAAGLALAALASTTDPTLSTTHATWHGRLHDLSFVLLGLSLMPGMLILGKAFRDEPRWRGFSTYTWSTAALALPTFFLKGAFFYVFLFSILLWTELVAWKLVKSSETPS